MTRSLFDRLVKRKASPFSKIVLLAMIRSAIDVTMANGETLDDESLGAVEETIREALSCVVDP